MEQNSFVSSLKPTDTIQGDIVSITTQTAPLSTLDEPVLVTLKRDFYAVLTKFFHVFIPKHSLTLLQQWDLWGPMILFITLAILLQSDSTNASAGVGFAQVFTLLMISSIIITINAKFLNGKISFFQTTCVLGYCLLPLILSTLINNFLFYLPFKSILYLIRFITIMIALLWSTYASMHFLGKTQHENRRPLVLYPIFLFYFLISWLILLHKQSK